MELALRLRDEEAAQGKLRSSTIKKFLDEQFLKRLNPYIKQKNE